MKRKQAKKCIENKIKKHEARIGTCTVTNGTYSFDTKISNPNNSAYKQQHQ